MERERAKERQMVSDLEKGIHAEREKVRTIRERDCITMVIGHKRKDTVRYTHACVHR